MNNYVNEAMEIAHDKTQSVFQQRHEFERLVKTIIEESKEKLLAQIQEQRQQQFIDDLNNPRF